MLIGIDDTDSPAGMCTTYLGAVLVRKLRGAGIGVAETRLVRLNPNAPHKTRGNAAVCIRAEGDPETAFSIAGALVDELADLSCENTNPGLVIAEEAPPPDFYWQAVQDFCTVGEAREILDEVGALSRGWKNCRGLIGATAAISSELPDRTYELLAYRSADRFGTPRKVERDSIFAAEAATWPHTWDSVDSENRVVVCVPHTPDPVLFGIRGESPAWVEAAAGHIVAEEEALAQVWVTNQGTDAHLVSGTIGTLLDGRSYCVEATVAERATTGEGRHVEIKVRDGDERLRCMAYEPTKGFRDVVRALVPDDQVVVCGSYKNGSLNLEKVRLIDAAADVRYRPPICQTCGKRMTSAGREKGYKCRRCGAREAEPECVVSPRSISTGWYEVPPTARRHLSKPLVRGEPGLRRNEFN
ncbi:DUF1743 domain-containing protein [Methanofollis aquaemaris]|uniref:tRNA(Ile2) 2-agmatinylcytidine synthetase TiaS n=1 Tax=Methanofollis aquaemaris TaxID=126734 RepID=A0A8A3S7B7_9EURY|nr:tRNA(Ile)(2)-agmatinylcytidine synthase [Methanofollis aquaemaris]QSZ67560.1 DUF1743 domain-containing protein [Methanofollis aquaemaris]